MLKRRFPAHPPGEADGASVGAAAAASGPLDAADAVRDRAPADDLETVLDEAALGRLRDLDPHGANRLLERVFEAFRTSALRLMPQMREALEASDPTAVRHVAHTLKSSSASIGALKLSALCADIERMIRLDTLERLPAQVALAELESVRVLAALQRLAAVAS